MGYDYDYLLFQICYEKFLWWVFGLIIIFFVVEVVGVFWINSLVLLFDVVYMVIDVLVLMIVLVVVWLSWCLLDVCCIYGYVWLEVLGVMINGVMLFVVVVYILWEVVGCFCQLQEIVFFGMLVIVVVGLVINLILMCLLQVGSGESFNVKGVYLEVWVDMFGLVVVIVGVLLIKWIGWKLIDLILVVLIGLWVLLCIYVLMCEVINVLLEGVFKGMDVVRVCDSLFGYVVVLDVYDLYVWVLVFSMLVLIVYIVMCDGIDVDVLCCELGGCLYDDFGIEYVMLQIEVDYCGEVCVGLVLVKGGVQQGYEGYDYGEDVQGYCGYVYY